MEKRAFYIIKEGSKISPIYRKLTLRNRYIKWNLKRVLPPEMPDGTWVVTLMWTKHDILRHLDILPGLFFREA